MADQLWWRCPAADRAKMVTATIDSYSSEQDQRKRRILGNLQRYEGRFLGDLNPRSYYNASPYTADGEAPYRVNIARALVATATAKIAGKQRPKAQFCATDADWSVKRKAKKKERFVEAAMLARQGQHHDAYSVGILAFRDACVADVGVLKFWADKQGRRVAIDRVLPWQYIVDPNEAPTGMPLNHFHDYGYDRFKLLEQFSHVKGAEEAIMTAPAVPENESGTARNSGIRDKARQVRVSEAWRLALSDKKPGHHSLCVGGFDLTGGDEEWASPFPPFELILWEPWFMGAFGTSLVDVAAPLCDELNAAFQRWANAELLGSNRIGFYRKNSVSKDQLESNEPCIWIEVEEGHDFPQMAPMETMGAASIQWTGELERLVYQIPGVSQQGATAQKAPGIDSGVALRTIENIASERFAVQWQAYERVMAIGATRQILRCVNELEEDGEGVVFRFPAGNELLELNSSDFDNYDVPDEAIQVYAVSGLVNTPADRLDLAEKLYTMGILSKEGFKRVIQYKDIDQELSSENEQSTLLEKYIEKWLDAEEPKKGKKSKGKPVTYPVSLKWMNLEEAIIQVGRAAMRAELDEAPGYNMGFFMDFLALCDSELQKRAEAQAQLAGVAGGGPGLQAVNQAAMGPGTVPMGGAPPPMEVAA